MVEGGPTLPLMCWVTPPLSVPQASVCKMTGLHKTRVCKLETFGLPLACRQLSLAFTMVFLLFGWISLTISNN